MIGLGLSLLLGSAYMLILSFSRRWFGTPPPREKGERVEYGIGVWDEAARHPMRLRVVSLVLLAVSLVLITLGLLAQRDTTRGH